MRYAPNRLLWRFFDAAVPAVWKSKQAKRIYDAAMEAENDGSWIEHAASGTVKVASNRDSIPTLQEPRYGHNRSDAIIEASVQRHIAKLRQQADHLENVLRAYGPNTFRKPRQPVPAPAHPLHAEDAILRVISGDDVDELWINGRHFVRDASRAFVRAND